MDNEEVTTVESSGLSSSEFIEDSEEVTSLTSYFDSNFLETVETTYDIQVVTTLDNLEMYQIIHQDLTNISGLLCVIFVLLFLGLLVRYINKIYHYLFH